MDHNLDDSLNLESTMGEMDFESSDVVVSQTDITQDPGSQDADMNMEFEHIEEQPILMDSGNEEIIVSDFMGDQFNLQEYSIQDDQTSEMTTVEDSNLSARSESMIDLQFETQNVTQSIPEAKEQPQYIAVRAAPSTYPFTSKQSKATMLATMPGQVAIAPKPPKLVPLTGTLFSVPQSKQVAIAPKPVTLTANKANFLKKVPLSSVVQGGAKGNAVIAQIGKQLVMMPPGSSQKIKLLPANNPGIVQYLKAQDQAQLIPNKNVGAQQINKPVMAKVIQLQGQQSVDISNQPAVITKIVPKSTANMQQTRYIMQTKTVPISIGNKVIMASPTKQGVKYTRKQQILTLKSPTAKLMPMPAASTAGTTTKKVVLTANPSQNVILKTTAPPKTAQVTKDGKVIVQGQRSQLHQINVPGKGIQYIRLITNQPPSASKTKQQSAGNSGPTKTFVVSDSQGNLVPVSAAKTTAGQQQYILKSARPTDKWPQKLTKIAAAPVSVKPAPLSQPVVRSSQSLLAPLSPVEMEQTADFCLKQEQPAEQNIKVEINEQTVDAEDDPDEDSSDGAQGYGSTSEDDSKAAIQQLLTSTNDLRHGLKQSQSPVQNDNADNVENTEAPPQEQPFIVISSNYMAQENTEREPQQDDSNIDGDAINNFLSPRTPPDNDLLSEELAFKPRRACNCTKSQCLKLYCDCFAHGEFCNSCNCHNCYNNLDHEELRQRAIRACLERNPNAFRPKIGKTKAGGPEIIRRHNKGCNCKRSGCLKNYCECYEAKIACTAMCKCVGCRNVEDTLSRRRPAALYRPQTHTDTKQPCTFMTNEVIEAVCQCLLAAAVDPSRPSGDRARDVLDEFGRCLQDIIAASHHQLLEQGRA